MPTSTSVPTVGSQPVPKKPSNAPRVLVWLCILLLLTATVALGLKLWQTTSALQTARAALTTRQINDRVLNFAQLFVSDVLSATQEVDFETRLKLENAVRAINDPKILAQWQRFIASPDPAAAQLEVKQLLALLISRIRVTTSP